MDEQQPRGGLQAKAEQCVVAAKEELDEDTPTVPRLLVTLAGASGSVTTRIKQEVDDDDDGMSTPHAQTKMVLDEGEEEECKIDIENEVLCKLETVSDCKLPNIAMSNNLTQSTQEGEENKELGTDVGDSNAPAYNSTHCDYPTLRKSKLPARLRANQGPKDHVYKCLHCDYTTKMERNLTVHLRSKHDRNANVYKCEQCEYAAKLPSRLRKHVKVKHNLNTVYTCAQCDFVTKWPQNLPKHVKVKHGPNTVYTCAQCDFATKLPQSLREHMKVKHDPNGHVYKCAQCDYATRRKRNIQKHVRSKHDPNPEVFKCVECDFTTRSKHTLRAHVKVKHDPNADVYKCAQCDYTTKLLQSLRTHVRVKHDPNVNVHKCEQCDYVTNWPFKLRQHVNAKHDPNPDVYRCAQCDYATKLLSTLRQHVKLKHDPNAIVYMCEQCDYTTKRKSNLIKHVRVMHDVCKCTQCMLQEHVKVKPKREQCVAPVKEEVDQDTAAVPPVFVTVAGASASPSTRIKQELEDHDEAFVPHAENKIELDENEGQGYKISIENHLLCKWETMSDKGLSTIATSQNAIGSTQEDGRDKELGACVGDSSVEASKSVHNNDQTNSQCDLSTHSEGNQVPKVSL